LIYTLQIEDGKSIIVHVNRLKRAHDSQKLSRNTLDTKEPVLVENRKPAKQSKPQLDSIENDSREVEENVPPMRVNTGEQSEGRDTDEESASEDRRHSEWLPETRYLQRKISRETGKSLGSTSDIPYALRSRATRTQLDEDMGELGNTSL
jgi:hypothetical protein